MLSNEIVREDAKYYFHQVSEKDILEKVWLAQRLTTINDRTETRTQIC